MARKGRKRKVDAPRQASGKIAYGRSTRRDNSEGKLSPVVLSRMRHDAGMKLVNPLLGTELGRWYLEHKIDTAEYSGALHYHQQRLKADKILGLPSRSPVAVNIERTPRSTNGEQPLREKDIDMLGRLRALEDRISFCLKDLINITLLDKPPNDYEGFLNLKRGFNILSKEFA